MLLIATLAVISVANFARLFPGDPAATVSRLLDAAGNLLGLAAALALVLQQGRNNLGRVIDTTIAALAISGLLWNGVLLPNLLSDYRVGASKLALFLVVFALSGVLGALAQMVITQPVAALRPLIAAVALALVADAVVAVTADRQVNTAAGMLLIGAYTAVGLFGLAPTASQLVAPAPPRPDTLSLGRLVFLGLSVAILPIVVGAQQMAGGNHDGLVLVASSAALPRSSSCVSANCRPNGIGRSRHSGTRRPTTH